MAGAWVAALIAVSLATAGEPEEPEEASQLEDDPAEQVGEGAPVAVALVEPGPGLPSAPPGPPLADSAPLLLDRVERPDGTALERLVEPSGEVVLHEVTRAGTVVSCRTVGSLLAMRVLEQRAAAGGEVIQVARDASGALLRYVVDAEGDPRAVTIVAPAPR